MKPPFLGPAETAPTASNPAGGVRYVPATQTPGSSFDEASEPSKVPGGPFVEQFYPTPGSGTLSAPSAGQTKPFKITGG